jgi:hypothetical protein
VRQFGRMSTFMTSILRGIVRGRQAFVMLSRLTTARSPSITTCWHAAVSLPCTSTVDALCARERVWASTVPMTRAPLGSTCAAASLHSHGAPDPRMLNVEATDFHLGSSGILSLPVFDACLLQLQWQHGSDRVWRNQLDFALEIPKIHFCLTPAFSLQSWEETNHCSMTHVDLATNPVGNLPVGPPCEPSRIMRGCG